MSRTVKLSRIEAVLNSLSYPVDREVAADELADVTVELADGEANLGDLISETTSDSYDSAAEFRDELYEYLPTEAIGEPGQSEGEG
ncbi:hypothetical protein HWV23_05600 [Natronomonas halophila]|uniref:DUF5789 family protein n=1 Tax=Natronomonas halophila TaxID=2747817 RepID=UPI0015B64E44|nr:hypothetical protein [Natronomonas halophila]QLD85219.1 hypothetical protein HWV23_05600 [Natronomonas halophila]